MRGWSHVLSTPTVGRCRPAMFTLNKRHFITLIFNNMDFFRFWEFGSKNVTHFMLSHKVGDYDDPPLPDWVVPPLIALP